MRITLTLRLNLKVDLETKTQTWTNESGLNFCDLMKFFPYWREIKTSNSRSSIKLCKLTSASWTCRASWSLTTNGRCSTDESETWSQFQQQLSKGVILNLSFVSWQPPLVIEEFDCNIQVIQGSLIIKLIIWRHPNRRHPRWEPLI